MNWIKENWQYIALIAVFVIGWTMGIVTRSLTPSPDDCPPPAEETRIATFSSATNLISFEYNVGEVGLIVFQSETGSIHLDTKGGTVRYLGFASVPITDVWLYYDGEAVPLFGPEDLQ